MHICTDNEKSKQQAVVVAYKLTGFCSVIAIVFCKHIRTPMISGFFILINPRNGQENKPSA
jgi:hypothetical protein